MTRLMKKVLAIVGMTMAIICTVSAIAFTPLVVWAAFAGGWDVAKWAVVVSLVAPVTGIIATICLGMLKR